MSTLAFFQNAVVKIRVKICLYCCCWMLHSNVNLAAGDMYVVKFYIVYSSNSYMSIVLECCRISSYSITRIAQFDYSRYLVLFCYSSFIEMSPKGLLWNNVIKKILAWWILKILLENADMISIQAFQIYLDIFNFRITLMCDEPPHCFVRRGKRECICAIHSSNYWRL